MYEIDFNTCTADDVITRSMVCHPSCFIEKLKAAAGIHYAAAREMIFDKVAASCARLAGDNASGAAELVRDYPSSSDEAIEAMSFGQKIAAFGAAHQLQCIPFRTALEIIERK